MDNVEKSDKKTDRLDEIKHLLELVDDRIGPDSSLRWLIGEVDRLREDLTKIRLALFDSPLMSVKDLADYITHQRQGALTELAEIHDLTAEALGYQRAPSLEEDPNCPCPGQFITGEHTAQTLVMQLINNYQAVVHNHKLLLQTMSQTQSDHD